MRARRKSDLRDLKRESERASAMTGAPTGSARDRYSDERNGPLFETRHIII
jgi:hypothetical protein